MDRSFHKPGCLFAAALLASPLAAGGQPRVGFARAVLAGITAYLLADPLQAAGAPAVTGPALAPARPEAAMTGPGSLAALDLGGVLASYPSDQCQGYWIEDDAREQACRPGDPVEPTSPAQATRFSEAMGRTEVLEEYRHSAEHQIQDLRSCVCRALHIYRNSDSQGRDQALLGRLKNARAQRRDLSTLAREANLIRRKVWERLGQEPSLWQEPDDAVLEPEWPEGVPYPVRADFLGEVVEEVTRAGAQFDREIAPLIDQLKARTSSRSKGKSRQAPLALPASATWSNRK